MLSWEQRLLHLKKKSIKCWTLKPWPVLKRQMFARRLVQFFNCHNQWNDMIFFTFIRSMKYSRWKIYPQQQYLKESILRSDQQLLPWKQSSTKFSTLRKLAALTEQTDDSSEKVCKKVSSFFTWINRFLWLVWSFSYFRSTKYSMWLIYQQPKFLKELIRRLGLQLQH